MHPNLHIPSFGVLGVISVILGQTALDLASKAADVSAKQSDRWHEDALLVIFFVTLGALTRWGMKQLDSRDQRIEALGVELGKTREKFSDFAINQSEKMATVITHNTEVI